jgi:UDP-N-acetylmuramoyl-L-alanyl-D-glutamate--2,6-diaminopimelate ligase
MRLSELVRRFPGLALLGPDLEASSLAVRAQDAEPGCLFIALPGAKGHGLSWEEEAVRRGAVAVLSDRKGEKNVSYLVHPQPREILAVLSFHFYGHPEKALRLAGITGTTGKTTTAHLVHSILSRRAPAGFLGTTHYQTGKKTFASPYTTPEAPILARMLRLMVQEGCPHAVMEVSSHALAFGRVEGLEFAAAAFTNLGRDHLDFHVTPEDYLAVKSRIFDHLAPGGIAVLNAADPRVGALQLPGKTVLTFSTEGKADVTAPDVRFTDRGTEGTLDLCGTTVAFTAPLFGKHNTANILAAASVLTALGIPPEEIRDGLATFPGVPGRLERVDLGQKFHVFVDYAHTPEGFEQILSAVRDVSQSKIITLFGCGGDRDRGKRRIMGEIAGRLSDIVILTTDNPRSEDPAQICQEISEGVLASGQQKVLIVLDRADAIRQALHMANPHFVVMLLGKGHETTQIIGDRILPFSDVKEAQKALKEIQDEA